MRDISVLSDGWSGVLLYTTARFPLPSSMSQHWLVKQEPTAYSWDQFAADGKTDWTGVRNFQARNNLRSMKRSASRSSTITASMAKLWSDLRK